MSIIPHKPSQAQIGGARNLFCRLWIASVRTLFFLTICSFCLICYFCASPPPPVRKVQQVRTVRQIHNLVLVHRSINKTTKINQIPNYTLVLRYISLLITSTSHTSHPSPLCNLHPTPPPAIQALQSAAPSHRYKTPPPSSTLVPATPSHDNSATS